VASDRAGIVGFLLGVAGMFAAMYSTQAILPELSRDFGVSASRAGLTVSAVVLAVAVGAWAWGPISDRIGRPRAIRTAAWLLVPPSLGVALAPTFELLLACRVLQGLCMPGLLVAGAPYVVEAFVPRVGARVMAWYVSALVLGGLVGRVGVAVATGLVGWRPAVGALALAPLAAALVMRGRLPDVAPPRRSGRGTTWEQLRIFAPLVILGLLGAFVLSKTLNALLLGEQYARSMGLDVQKARIAIVTLTAILAGSVTAFCGPIGFIGIAVPHLCRTILHTSDHRTLVPACVLMGGMVALVAALVAEMPGFDIVLPLNAVTSLIGAPVVIVVILKRRDDSKAFAS
jgi:MFS family permease